MAHEIINPVHSGPIDLGHHYRSGSSGGIWSLAVPAAVAALAVFAALMAYLTVI